MAKPSIYRDFMQALKRHWKTVLPHLKPLAEPRGSLPMASTFYAGFVGSEPIHVYFHFQTHSNIGGLFTINVILARDEFAPRYFHTRDESKLIDQFIEGPNRIGRFVRVKHGDKWWQLSRDEARERLCRRLGQPLTEEGRWCPESYDDPKIVVRDSVADVTFSVHLALRTLGLPGASG